MHVEIQPVDIAYEYAGLLQPQKQVGWGSQLIQPLINMTTVLQTVCACVYNRIMST